MRGIDAAFATKHPLLITPDTSRHLPPARYLLVRQRCPRVTLPALPNAEAGYESGASAGVKATRCSLKF